MDKNRITVIVPIYNVESYLPRCIESILEQTYSNLQIILVDDGSTDVSGKICDDYAEKDKRIEVYHTVNKGSVAARKLGIVHATGSYIGFVDSDDYIEKDMYEYLLKNIMESNADFIHTGYIEEKEGKCREIYGFENGIYDLKNTEAREDFLIKYVLHAKKGQEVIASMWSKLFRKELIEKSFFPLPDEQQLGEDVLCLFLSVLQSERIMLKKRAFYHHTIRQKSLSHISDVERIIQETALSPNVINVIRNYDRTCYKKLKRVICYFVANRLLAVMNRLNKGGLCLAQYCFNDIESLRGRKIALYGAGIVGQSYYSQFCKYGDIEIVAWFDSNGKNCRFNYVDVLDGTNMTSEYEFDKIIIAVLKETMAIEIREMLKENGLPEEKIVWQEPGNVLDFLLVEKGKADD